MGKTIHEMVSFENFIVIIYLQSRHLDDAEVDVSRWYIIIIYPRGGREGRQPPLGRRSRCAAVACIVMPCGAPSGAKWPSGGAVRA